MASSIMDFKPGETLDQYEADWEAWEIANGGGEVDLTTAMDKFVGMVWSDEQELLIDWAVNGSGNAVVIARAGCGKSTSLTYMASQAPEKLIFQTSYGKESVKDLQSKILVGECSTIHSAGFRNMRQDRQGGGAIVMDNKITWERIGQAKESFLVWVTDDVRRFNNAAISWATHDDQTDIIAGVLEWLKNTAPNARTLKEVFGVALNTLKKGSGECCVTWNFEELHKPEVNIQQVIMIVAMLVKQVCEITETAYLDKKAIFRCDFNDQLWIPVRTGTIKKRYELIFADEVQDCNACMLELLLGLLLPSGRMCMIGDPMQSLYGFRGADPDAIPRMIKLLNAQVFKLTVTRRCPLSVVAGVQHIVPDFQAAPGAVEGINDDILYDAMIGMVKPGDFVLSRTNKDLVGACIGLLAEKIKSYIVGRDVGIKLKNMLKKIEGRHKFQSVSEMVDRITTWAMNQIDTLTAEKNLSEKQKTDQAEDIMDQRRVFTLFAGECNEDNPKEIYGIIEGMFADPDSNKKDFVACSTCHRAKGLEAENVYVLEYSFRRPQDACEDRIRYVCETRSKHALYHVTKLIDENEGE